MRSNFQIWVNAVCEQVRFRPDHRSIEFELRDHYEEHVRDLLRLGRPRELEAFLRERPSDVVGVECPLCLYAAVQSPAGRL